MISFNVAKKHLIPVFFQYNVSISIIFGLQGLTCCLIFPLVLFPDLGTFNNPSSFLAALEVAVNKAMNDVESSSFSTPGSAVNSSSSSAVEALYRVRNSEATRLSRFLISELEKLGWDKVIDISDTFQKIKLRVIDVGNRKHSFELEFSSSFMRRYQGAGIRYDNYGRKSPMNDEIILQADLPYPISIPQSATVRLSEIYQLVADKYDTYQLYIKELADLDKNTFILEPTVPSLSEKYRRIAIDKTCSIMIEIDPHEPRKMGSIQFLGPADNVIKHRISVGQNSNKW